jgi:hypothetical protein
MLCNPFERQMDHGELDHGLGLTGVDFIVAIESAVIGQPCEGTFGNPALGKNDELGGLAFDDVNYPAEPAQGVQDDIPSAIETPAPQVPQGNRMNALIMMRERLLFRSSPDKGRAGGVCRAKIDFLPDLPPQTPLNPPLSGGKWANKHFPTPCGSVMQWPRNPNSIHAIALKGN